MQSRKRLNLTHATPFITNQIRITFNLGSLGIWNQLRGHALRYKGYVN